jgi:hypothetical protein
MEFLLAEWSIAESCSRLTAASHQSLEDPSEKALSYASNFAPDNNRRSLCSDECAEQSHASRFFFAAFLWGSLRKDYLNRNTDADRRLRGSTMFLLFVALR